MKPLRAVNVDQLNPGDTILDPYGADYVTVIRVRCQFKTVFVEYLNTVQAVPEFITLPYTSLFMTYGPDQDPNVSVKHFPTEVVQNARDEEWRIGHNAPTRHNPPLHGQDNRGTGTASWPTRPPLPPTRHRD